MTGSARLILPIESSVLSDLPMFKRVEANISTNDKGDITVELPKNLPSRATDSGKAVKAATPKVTAKSSPAATAKPAPKAPAPKAKTGTPKPAPLKNRIAATSSGSWLTTGKVEIEGKAFELDLPLEVRLDLVHRFGVAK